MDVLSDKKVTRLVATEGKTRIYEIEDGTWLTAREGTVAWRNNNPGNLKLGFKDSADHTVHTERSKEKALTEAQARYEGVVDLDQWGNVVFENYEAGREAQKQLLQQGSIKEKTVEELVTSYSVADYSGATHHANQIATIHATASAQGLDLHDKKVKDMNPEEVNALTDGLAKAEGWKPGIVQQTPPLTEDQLRTALAAPQSPAHPNAQRQGDQGTAVGQLQQDLAALGFTAQDGQPIVPDQHFGPRTREAVEAFQRSRGLHADGIAGPATLAGLTQATTLAQANRPSLLEAQHPAHSIYAQAYQCVARIDESQGRAPWSHTQMFAASLTSAALGAGMQRIDHVLLSDDASRGFAVQGALNSSFKQYTEVNVLQAINTPLNQSSQEATAHLQVVVEPPQAQQMNQQAPVQQQAAPLGLSR